MSDETGLPVLDGERFSTITPDDHGGIIYITVFLALTYSILTLGARVGIKWNMLGDDDWAMGAAQVVALGQYISVLVALSHGLGKSTSIVSSEQYAVVSKATYTSQILIIAALALAKCSVILLIRRVFTRDMKNFWMICTILLGFIGVWALASIITCPGYAARWKAVVALDVATELLFVILPIYLVWGLQMSRNLKLRVVLAFAFRIPVAAFALAFLNAVDTYRDHENTGVAYSAVIIWHQVELGYSLIAATIPCLKSFIKSFDTGFGLEVGYNTHPYGSANSRGYANGTKGGQSFQMSSLKGSESTKDSSPQTLGQLRPEQIRNTTNIYHENDPPREDASITSGNSQEMIIRRDVQWDVRHDYVPHAK
ncbi:hypothetical protein H2201_000453 [Coniosporium apollinis]|uniref:Rhodopsin domain-containing protein n=1 Tax=Coniosporium apollinis TaxID=61459 RepID=A0ABQ9P4R7_9PEZI|nr:hypothetical protein H2201_000453 [Coniosporium apollinis]